jgi:TIP49-like protein
MGCQRPVPLLFLPDEWTLQLVSPALNLIQASEVYSTEVKKTEVLAEAFRRAIGKHVYPFADFPRRDSESREASIVHVFLVFFPRYFPSLSYQVHSS